MEDHLCCYGCGLIFPSDEAAFEQDGDDMAASCPECGSVDVVTYETYIDNAG